MAEKKTKTINHIWTRLVIYLSLTTLLSFSLSYDLYPAYDIFTSLFFLISGIASVICLIDAISICVSNKKIPPPLLSIIVLLLSLSMPLNFFYRNGSFWGRKLTEAAFLDDRSRMDLTLFENRHFLINSNWLFGSETFTGKYQIRGDTIEFDKYPVVDNDFISKKIIRSKNKIYFRKDNHGNYDTTFYYFQIGFEK